MGKSHEKVQARFGLWGGGVLHLDMYIRSNKKDRVQYSAVRYIKNRAASIRVAPVVQEHVSASSRRTHRRALYRREILHRRVFWKPV